MTLRPRRPAQQVVTGGVEPQRLEVGLRRRAEVLPERLVERALARVHRAAQVADRRRLARFCRSQASALRASARPRPDGRARAGSRTPPAASDDRPPGLGRGRGRGGAAGPPPPGPPGRGRSARASRRRCAGPASVPGGGPRRGAGRAGRDVTLERAPLDAHGHQPRSSRRPVVELVAFEEHTTSPARPGVPGCGRRRRPRAPGRPPRPAERGPSSACPATSSPRTPGRPAVWKRTQRPRQRPVPSCA